MIGVLGGGQLGRMLALAGYPLGFDFTFVDPASDACAAPLGRHLVAAYDDSDALDELARTCEVVTFEFERVPAAAAERLAETTRVYPGPRALAAGQDRLTEKQMFAELGFEVPRFAPAEDRAGLERALEETGLPAVVKTRTEGYDGKGQVVVRTKADIERAATELAGKLLLVEEQVPFDRELSVLAVRSAQRAVAFYPLVENAHRDGILRLSRAPAPNLAPELTERANSWARALVEHLDYVGVLAIELFQSGDRLAANEFAPRVHNSGHWTIEGAVTSQFENHLRAVAGLPLGSTAPTGHSAMINLIGELPERARIMTVQGAHLHRYGKDPRPGRKIGHVTVVCDDAEALAGPLEQLGQK